MNITFEDFILNIYAILTYVAKWWQISANVFFFKTDSLCVHEIHWYSITVTLPPDNDLSPYIHVLTVQCILQYIRFALGYQCTFFDYMLVYSKQQQDT